MANWKLAVDKIEEIKKLLATGLNQQEVASKAKVSVGTVSQVKRGHYDKGKREDPTDARIHELEGRVESLREDLRHTKRKLRAAQQSNVNFQDVALGLRDLIKPFKPPKALRIPERRRVKHDEDAVLQISDGHWDCVVTPEQTQGLETYNFDVAMARAERLVETVIKLTTQTLTNYRIHRLVVPVLGDMQHGEIHGAEPHTHFGNAKKSALAGGQLLGQMLYDLSTVFPMVDVVILSGNHGRKPNVRGKDYTSPQNNWDYLIGGIAELYCRDLKNVNFLIPNSFSTILNVRGRNFHFSHGDDIKSQLGIPYYGVQRKTMRLVGQCQLQDIRLHAVGMGHFHTPHYEAQRGVETFINGPWAGCDPFSFNACDAYNDPCQWFYGVNERRITFRFNMELKFPGDTKGPQRYTTTVRD